MQLITSIMMSNNTYQQLSPEEITAIVSSICAAVVGLLHTLDSVSIQELAEATSSLSAMDINEIYSVIRCRIMYTELPSFLSGNFTPEQETMFNDVFIRSTAIAARYTEQGGIQMEWLQEIFRNNGDWGQAKLNFLTSFRRGS